MKILVTGGAGFVGSHVVDLLIEENHQVVVVDSLVTGDDKNVNNKATFYQMDIRSKELEGVFEKEKPEAVYHLAAQSVVPPSIKDPLFDQSVNIGGTIYILELMKKFGAKKIIYSSSAAIYGNPTELPINEDHQIQPISPYGLSKAVAEQYIALYNRMYGLDYTILRYANIYGPRQTAIGEGGVVAVFTNRLKNNEELIINGDGRHTRDYIYVGDVARANLKALEHGSAQTVNVSTGIATSIIDLVEDFEQVVGTKIATVHAEERAGDIVHSSLDPTRGQQHLDWKAEVSLVEGLKQTYQA